MEPRITGMKDSAEGMQMMRNLEKTKKLELERREIEILKRAEREKEQERLEFQEKKETKELETATLNIGRSDLLPSTKVDKEETQLEDLQNPPSILNMGVLPTMNLIDESALHLRGLMKGLFVDEPEPSVKLYDIGRVETAISCAHQIANLIRCKRELITEAREWNK